ncbi:MAG: patatin-like phospholipase family protein [Thermoanaerobaculales bacterium]|jgi:NTE family protein|nr:patatin-like phospholipase family protein [Thermoanaerobaculales bacterium]
MSLRGSIRRLAMRARPPTLALGGGGARGFVHIGVLRVLDERSVPIGAIAGTSMGSLMGAMYLVLGDAAKVEQAWRQAVDDGVLPAVRQVRMVPRVEKKEHPLLQVARQLRNRVVVSFALNRSTVLDGFVLDRVVDRLLPDVLIEDLPRPFAAVATDLSSGAETLLRTGSLRRAVKASSSIPGMVPATIIGGRPLVDGGVVAEVPVAPARVLGWPVLAVDASMEIPPPADDDLALDTMMRTQQMTANLLRERQLAGATWVVRPDIGHVAWADWGAFEAMIAAGASAARAFFDLEG